MFGRMNVVSVLDLQNAAGNAGAWSETAVAELLGITGHPRVERWIQLRKALLIFLVVPGDPESGAFYVYDRVLKEWFWVDFDDDKFGGYTTADFDQLIRECHFLDIVERPQLLTVCNEWIVGPGSRPQQTRDRSIVSRSTQDRS
jgi:hypothetical protein